jgi:hypothetical protein
MPTPRSPKISCWHLWADDAGRTHQTLCKLAAFEWQGMGGGTRVEMGPGDLAFGGNRMARPGPRRPPIGTLGEEPCRPMMVQLDPARWAGARPGAFK